MSMRTIVAVTVASIALAESVIGQVMPNASRILLPGYVHMPVTGANNTKFHVMFAIAPQLRMSYYPSVGSHGEFATGELSAGEHEIELPVQVGLFGEGAGRLLFVAPAAEAAARASYLLVTTTSDGRRVVSTLPVVRETQFLQRRSQILNVPFVNREPAVRRRLRIYDVDNSGTMSVHVRPRFTNTAILAYNDRVFHVSSRAGSDPSYPYFVEIDIDREFGTCVPYPFDQSATSCLGGTFVIELDTGSHPGKYWAFVSVTDNATGSMYALWPQ